MQLCLCPASLSAFSTRHRSSALVLLLLLLLLLSSPSLPAWGLRSRRSAAWKAFLSLQQQKAYGLCYTHGTQGAPQCSAKALLPHTEQLWAAAMGVPLAGPSFELSANVCC